MPEDPSILSRHLQIRSPSNWVVRFAPLVPADGRVLDLAAGGGRHARYFLDRGHGVLAADKNISAMADLAAMDDAEVMEIDLEDGKPWPFTDETFAAVVVSNYLFRPHLPGLIESLMPRGVLIYETFARGNEAFNRPRNPDHLLKSGELLDLARERLQVVAYEHGVIAEEPAGVKQRLCALNDLGWSDRDDGEPAAYDLYPDPDGGNDD
ncbi:MAG: SAM-dependent methyltransferase [Rhodospirillaceae bacterium]